MGGNIRAMPFIWLWPASHKELIITQEVGNGLNSSSCSPFGVRSSLKVMLTRGLKCDDTDWYNHNGWPGVKHQVTYWTIFYMPIILATIGLNSSSCSPFGVLSSLNVMLTRGFKCDSTDDILHARDFGEHWWNSSRFGPFDVLSLSLSLSICLCLCLYPCLCLPVCLSLSVSISVCLSLSLCLSLSVSVSLSLFLSRPRSLCLCLPACLPVCLSVCLSLSLSLSLPVRLSVCLSLPPLSLLRKCWLAV